MKIFILFFLPLLAFSDKSIENQRKYEFSFKEEEFFNIKKIAEFQIFKHAQVTTQDIYFDTKGRDIQKAGMTLRIRRAKKNNNFTYAIQLKSEKGKSGLSGQELDYSYLESQEFNKVKLSQTVDQFFEMKDQQQASLEILQKWIVSKADSTFLPFVFLKNKKIKLNSIAATLHGISDRTRFHVFVDQDHQLKGIDYSKTKNKKDLPDFFKASPSVFWLLEGSFDNSTFFAVNSNRQVGTIKELELENKIKPAKYGNRILDRFEYDLGNIEKGKFKLTPKQKSKYLQMIEIL